MENLSLDILDEVSNLLQYKLIPQLMSCEIFRLTGPYDLLSLARTSKPFWTHLRSKTCIPVWRHVYRFMDSFVEVPRDYPNWLDGVTFTKLLYEIRCAV
jgi:hypothetical protein